MPSSSPSVYLFGILRAGTPLAAPQAVARIGAAEFAPWRPLTEGPLSAIVSDLRLPQGMTLDALLEAPEQVEALALHHHQVLQRLAVQAAALPLRFGALFSHDDAVRETLARGRERFLRTLDDIDGAVEWGLKAFCDRARLGARLRGASAEIAEVQAKVAAASEGKRFFLERRLERLVEEESARAIDRCLEQTARRIAPRCRRAVRVRIQPAQLCGQAGEMVFNGAFLVDRQSVAGFLDAIDDLRHAHADFGFDYRPTGPWPAYSFAAAGVREDDHAA